MIHYNQTQTGSQLRARRIPPMKRFICKKRFPLIPRICFNVIIVFQKVTGPSSCVNLNSLCSGTAGTHTRLRRDGSAERRGCSSVRGWQPTCVSRLCVWPNQNCEIVNGILWHYMLVREEWDSLQQPAYISLPTHAGPGNYSQFLSSTERVTSLLVQTRWFIWCPEVTEARRDRKNIWQKCKINTQNFEIWV